MALILNNITDVKGEYIASRSLVRCPSHPGEVLSEVVENSGQTKTAIALMLGISRAQLYDIMNERKPVSAKIALKLGKLFGGSAGVWLRMQGAYDIFIAQNKIAAELEIIPTLKAA